MLYRGTVLAEAQQWADRNTPSRDETMFLHASRDAQAGRQRREAANRQIQRSLLISFISVVVVASLLVTFILQRDNAELQDEAATLQLRATQVGQQAAALQTSQAFTQLELDRFGTLEAGDVIVPLGTQTPASFIPTVTQIAVLNAHDPSLQENNRVDEAGVEMVRVPAGCFFMGSDRGISNEQPTHQVCLDEFWIDKTEVTNARYGLLPESVFCNAVSSEPEQPRNCVTWFEALEHCESRGARLPTEDEWEYAARGPDSLVYPWGNEFDPERVVYRENSDLVTAPVGSRPDGASWVGALDMSGNLWEWVSTAYDDVDFSSAFPYPYNPDDGREDLGRTNNLRVLRGGSFLNTSNGLRAADRGRFDPFIEDSGIGLRCARS